MRNKSILVCIVSCCLVIFLLAASAFDWQTVFFGSDVVVEEITQSTIIVESKFFGEPVPLVHAGVQEYMKNDNAKTPQQISEQYPEQKDQLAKGVPLEYSYNVKGMPAGVSVEKAVLEVSQSAEGTAKMQYAVDVVEQKVSLFHLKTGTTYHYQLVLTLTNGRTAGTLGTFTTAASPRVLTVDGLINVRDIGGYETMDGRTVRQGMIIRGSELDGMGIRGYLTLKGEKVEMKDGVVTMPKKGKSQTRVITVRTI